VTSARGMDEMLLGRMVSGSGSALSG
jgi:hypothetical protein